MASTIIKPIAVFRDIIKKADISLDYEDIPKKPIKRMLKLFDTVEDSRLERNTDYPLQEILMIAFFATLSGAQGWTDYQNFGITKEKWLKRFMALKCGTPSHDTFRRVFALIDPEHLQKATTTFLIDNIKIIKRAFKIDIDGLRQYCVDGKEAKGTGRNPGFEKTKYGTSKHYMSTISPMAYVSYLKQLMQKPTRSPLHRKPWVQCSSRTFSSPSMRYTRSVKLSP